MVPSWLRVESAITFFISHSTIAAIPARHAVIAAANKRINSNDSMFRRMG